MKAIEEMTLAELRVEAKSMGMKVYSTLKKLDLLNAVTIKKFISDRQNQANAIKKAQELKDTTEGRWFTLRRYVTLTKSLELDKYRRVVKGKPTVTVEEASVMVETLALFGLMDRKLKVGKQPQYKVKMKAAVMAIEAHNRNAEATAIIEGEGGRIIVKG